MLYEKWSTILLSSILLVVFANSLLAGFTKIYYKNKSMGHLSHSQLRIKQGNATFEQRLNVFAQSFIFGFISFRVYLITLLVWLVLSGLYYLYMMLSS